MVIRIKSVVSFSDSHSTDKKILLNSLPNSDSASLVCICCVCTACTLRDSLCACCGRPKLNYIHLLASGRCPSAMRRKRQRR